MTALAYHRVCNNLVEIAESVARMEFISIEEKESFRDISPLCGDMVMATESAASAASGVLGYYEQYVGEAPDACFGEVCDDVEPDSRVSYPVLNQIDQLSSRPDGCRQVVDLAWIGTWTLKQKRTLLTEAVGSNEFWRALGQCLSAKRMIVKTTAAIEKAVAEVEGVPSRLSYLHETELQRSLKVRKLYFRFRRKVSVGAPPDLSGVESRIRLACVSFAQVFGDPAYSDVRVQDRQLFRKLQGHGLAWIAERRVDQSKATGVAGLRILQEMTAFAECLMMVNNRSELREHDRNVAGAVYDRLRTGDSMSDIRADTSLFGMLKTVEGRDDELDSLLSSDSLAPDGTWLDALERVAAI